MYQFLQNSGCVATESFHQKPGGNQKLNVKHSILYKHMSKIIIISSNIFTIRPLNSLIYVNTDPNESWYSGTN